MPKTLLRQRLLQLRHALPAEVVARESALIQQRFLALPEFAAARSVALYSPIRGEVATAELFRAVLAAGKRALFPRLVGSHLEFVVVTELGQLVPGRFGIPEPQAGAPVSLAAIDLMAVPGVAFDRCGHRIGYGQGYYDRLLHRQRHGCCLAGLAFDLQLLAALPAEGHDVRMDLILTASEELRFAHNSLAEGGLPPRKGGFKT